MSEASFEHVVTFEDGYQLARTSEYATRGQAVKDDISAGMIIGITTDMFIAQSRKKSLERQIDR